MSEQRIKELAVQAGAYWKEGYVLQPNGDYVWQDKANINHCDMDINLFAGLVREEAYQEGYEVAIMKERG